MSQSHFKEKLWTKDFILVSITNFFIILIFYLLMVTIGSFATKEFHASTSQAGLVTGIYIVGALIGRLFTGRIINQVGSKKILMIGMILFILTIGLYLIHGGIGLLLVSRLLNGVAAGIASTATSTIVAQTLPATRKGEGIGYFSMSTTLGTAIGPFFGILLGRITTYNNIFLFCIILAIIGFFITFIVKAPKKVGAPATKQKFSFKQYIEPNALSMALVTFLMSLGYAAILSFITTFAEERDLIGAASFFFLVYAIAILVTRPFSGRLMDTKGSNAVMVPCFILFAVGLFLVSGAHSGFVLLAAAVIIGAGYGNLQSGAQAISIKVTPPERAGLATSTFFIALDAGLGFGPYILGFLEPVIGFGQMYVWLAVLIVITLVIYFLLHGRRDQQLIAKARA